MTDAELAALDAAGVRGVRFNFVKRLVDTTPPEALLAIARRVAPLGWHVVIYFEAQDLPTLEPFLAALPTIVVVDHMGRPDLTLPVDGPQFEAFVRLMRGHGNIWSKVTCPDRLSASGPPDYADFIPFAKRLVDLIPKIATTVALQRRLLVDNPLHLYWDR